MSERAKREHRWGKKINKYLGKLSFNSAAGLALTRRSDLCYMKAAATEGRPSGWRKLPPTYSCTFADKLLPWFYFFFFKEKKPFIYSLEYRITQMSVSLSHFLSQTHKPQKFKHMKRNANTLGLQEKMPMRNATGSARRGLGEFSFHTLSASMKISFPDSFIPPNEALPVSRFLLFK